MLQLTFDADDTIYEVSPALRRLSTDSLQFIHFFGSFSDRACRQHGMDLEADSWIVDALLTLMQQGLAPVTAQQSLCI